MIQIKIEDGKFLEQHGAVMKFTNLKKRPAVKKGRKAEDVDAETISVPHAKIVEKTTKRVWVDWTPGETDEDAAAKAIEKARKNILDKPMTPIEAVQALGEANDELEVAKQRIAELEAAQQQAAQQQGGQQQQNTNQN